MPGLQLPHLLRPQRLLLAAAAAAAVAAAPAEVAGPACLSDIAVWDVCEGVADVCKECSLCFGADPTRLPSIVVTGESGNDTAGEEGRCGGCWLPRQSPLYTCGDFAYASLCSQECLECAGCFGLPAGMVPSKAELRLDGTNADCGAPEIEQADYGNMAWGCCGWADITMVHASPARWEEVRSWAPNAVSASLATQEECAALCFESPDTCEVWTWRELRGGDWDCSFKRRTSCAPSTCSAPPGTNGTVLSVVSGQRECSMPWMGFAPSPEEEEINQTISCVAENHVYGVLSAGACASARILEAHGPAEALSHGVARSWWQARDAYEWAGTNLLSPEEALEGCHVRCAQVKECFAINVFPSGEFAGLCLLMEEITCEHAFAEFPGAMAAFGAGCTSLGEEPPDSLSAHPVPCGAGRCRGVRTRGAFDGDDFAPAESEGEECYLHAWKAEELVTPTEPGCLENRWMVLAGGSNIYAQGTVIVNFLSGRSLLSDLDGVWCCPYPRYVGGVDLPYDIIDVVFDEGLEVVYLGMERVESQVHGLVPGGPAAVKSFLDQAPAATPGGFRFTIMAAQFWEPALTMVQGVSQSVGGGWAAVQRIYWLQVSQWYRVCSWGECPRDDLMNLGETGVRSRYEAAMAEAFDGGLAEICNSTSTAACFISTNMWGGLMQAAPLTLYNEIVRNEVARRSQTAPRIHLLDVYEFSAQILSEVQGAHGSPMLYVWILQVALNAVCTSAGDLGRSASGCPATVSFAEQCRWEGLNQECSHFYCRARYPCTFERTLITSSNSSNGTDEGVCPAADLTGIMARLIAGHKPVALPPVLPAAQASPTPCARRLGEEWCDDDLRWALEPFGVVVTLCFIGWQVYKGRAGPGTAASAAGAKGCSKCSGAKGASAAAPAEGPPLPSLFDVVPEASDTVESGTAKAGSKSGAPAAAKEWLHALGAARFAASLHIVIGHMQNAGHVAWPGAGGAAARDLSYMFGWGFTWVPWYFMLSGYVLTHARLSSGKSKPVLQFCSDRLASIYPAYAVGLVLSLLLRLRREAPAMPWLGQLLQPWLLQAWVPPYAEVSLQQHCWFLSCLVPYWMVFEKVFTYISRLRSEAAMLTLLILGLVPWVTMVLIPGVLPDTNQYWYNDGIGDPSWSKGIENPWDYEFPEHSEDFWVTILKFHPLCYFHVFLFGMVLAQFRHTARDSLPYRRFARLAAEIGYLSLALVFFTEPIFHSGGTVFKRSTKLSARLSVLMPLQGLVLLGLSNSGGLLSRLFCAEFVVELGEISYSQYVLQFICWGVWPTVDGSIGPGFFVFLFGCAVCLYYLVQRPCQKLWRGAAWYTTVLLPTVLTVTLVAASVAMQEEAASAAVDVATSGGASVDGWEFSFPGEVPFAGDRERWGLYDVPLDLEALTPMSDQFAQAFLINPTVAVTGSSTLLLAARHHAQGLERGSTSYEGVPVVELRQMYHSEVVAGEVKWQGTFNASLRALGGLRRVNFTAPPGLRGPEEAVEWVDLCPANGVYIPENNTLIRKHVTGPEDPRLVQYGSGALLSFYSMPLATPDCPAVPATKVFLSPEPLAESSFSAGCQPPFDSQLEPGRGARFCVARGGRSASRSEHEASCAALAEGARLVELEDSDPGLGRVSEADAEGLRESVLAQCGELHVPVSFEDATCSAEKSSERCAAFCSYGCVEGTCWSTDNDLVLCSDKWDWFAFEDGSICFGGLRVFQCMAERKLYKCPNLDPQGGEGICVMDLQSSGVVTDWSEARRAVELQCSKRADKSEKNWIGFEYQGRLHWVYQVLPHVVAEVRPQDGSCFQVGRTDYAPLTGLALRYAGEGLKVHGSGSAIPWADCGGAAPECYLAIFHLLNVTSRGRIYTHFFYKFEAGGDFGILASAREPLPLVASQSGPWQEPFAFVSGLAAADGEVMVSYGSGDHQPRALVMSTEQVENYFTCTS